MATRNSNNRSIRETKLDDGTVTYGAQVRVTGFKPVFRSFPVKSELITWRDELTKELRAQRKQGNVRPDATTATLTTLNTDYLADPETLLLGDFDDRKRQLDWWTAEYGHVKVLEFGVLHIRQGRNALLTGKGRLGSGRSKAGAGLPRQNGTVGRYLAAQRAAWNWARNSGYGLASRPWPTGVMLSEPKARVRYLSDEELMALQTAAAANGPVMSKAITVAITTGARQAELFGLTWGDVDFEHGAVRFIKTKNGEARSVHLPRIAIEALLALKPEKIDPAAPVFLTPEGGKLTVNRANTQWKRIREAAGLKNFRWHDLRHTCASFLAQNGATLLEIGAVLGHQSADITMKYAHLVAGKAVSGHEGMNSKLDASAKAAAKAAAAAAVPA